MNDLEQVAEILNDFSANICKIQDAIDKGDMAREDIAKLLDMTGLSEKDDSVGMLIWFTANQIYDQFKDTFAELSMNVDDVKWLIERKIQSVKDKEAVDQIYASMNSMTARYRVLCVLIAIVTLILLIFFW